MFTVVLSDNSSHSTHAMGNAANGLCTYALSFSAPANLKVSTASFASCGGLFDDIAVDPSVLVFDKTNTMEIDFSEASP